MLNSLNFARAFLWPVCRGCGWWGRGSEVGRGGGYEWSLLTRSFGFATLKPYTFVKFLTYLPGGPGKYTFVMFLAYLP